MARRLDLAITGAVEQKEKREGHRERDRKRKREGCGSPHIKDRRVVRRMSGWGRKLEGSLGKGRREVWDVSMGFELYNRYL